MACERPCQAQCDAVCGAGRVRDCVCDPFEATCTDLEDGDAAGVLELCLGLVALVALWSL